MSKINSERKEFSILDVAVCGECGAITNIADLDEAGLCPKCHVIEQAKSAKPIPFADSEALLVYAPFKSCTGLLYQDHELDSTTIIIAVAERVKAFPLVCAAVLADLARQHKRWKGRSYPLPCIISAVRLAEEVAA